MRSSCFLWYIELWTKLSFPVLSFKFVYQTHNGKIGTKLLFLLGEKKKKKTDERYTLKAILKSQEKENAIHDFTDHL